MFRRIQAEIIALVVLALIIIGLHELSAMAEPPAPENSSSSASVETQLSPLPIDSGKLIGVDLRDLIDYEKDTFPEISVILKSLRAVPFQYFPKDVNYSPEGPGISNYGTRARPKWRKRKDVVYGVEIASHPSIAPNGDIIVALNGFMHSTKSGQFFRKYELTLGGNPVAIKEVKILKDIPVSETAFSIEAGLISRKAVLYDRKNDIMKVYPLGVGGFDEGIMPGSRGKIRLMTPLFDQANLDRNFAIEARKDKDYYRGMPFIRLIPKGRSWSPFAFHIIQHPKMIRGFDSHGCMRLREKDLYEVFEILAHQKVKRIPVNIAFHAEEVANHPYPLREDGYVRVTNCAGPGETPKSCKDEHDLTQMHDAAGRPPIESLTPYYGEAMDLQDLLDHVGRDEMIGPARERTPGNPNQLPDFILDEIQGKDQPA